jgi:hypothetical protein
VIVLFYYYWRDDESISGRLDYKPHIVQARLLKHFRHEQYERYFSAAVKRLVTVRARRHKFLSLCMFYGQVILDYFVQTTFVQRAGLHPTSNTKQTTREHVALVRTRACVG